MINNNVGVKNYSSLTLKNLFEPGNFPNLTLLNTYHSNFLDHVRKRSHLCKILKRVGEKELGNQRFHWSKRSD